MRKLFAAILGILTMANQAYPETRIPPNGLSAQITVRVEDENGGPLEGAEVKGAFLFLKESDMTTVLRKTDKAGLAVLSSRALVKVLIFASKDGYFSSRDEYVFLGGNKSDWDKSINAGNWLPWNPTVCIRLVKNYHVPPTAYNSQELPIPTANEVCGFDAKRGVIFSLDSALEKKKTADFFIIVSNVREPPEEPGPYHASFDLKIFTTNACNGMVRSARNIQSVYPFETRLSQCVFTNNLHFYYNFKSRSNDTDTVDQSSEINCRDELSEEEYLLFRTQRAEDGSFEYAIYSKFTFEFPRTIRTVWFVPTETNDHIIVNANGKF